MTEAEELAYDAGYEEGSFNAECPGYDCIGYDLGFEAGTLELAESSGASIAECLRRLGVPILDGASVRWDAAERCLVVVAEGREVRVR